VLALVSALVAVVFLGSVPASVALRAPPRDAAVLPTAAARLSTLVVTVRQTTGGAVVPGATVRVFWGVDRRYYLAGSAWTDAGGRAELRELPTGAVWVLAEAKDLARRSTTLVLSRALRAIEVVLPPASDLPVRVEDDAHAPVAGATVLVRGADALPFGALTDADGRARFTRLGPGPFKLRVLARGYEPDVRSDVVGSVTVSLRRASALDVSVTDTEGHAVPHATVLVAGSGLWPARSLETDGEGHARVPGIGAGAYDIKAQQGQLVSKTEIGVKVERGETRAVSLVLAPGRMIPIVVTDGEGDHPHLVPNADVLLVEGGISSFPIQGRTGTFGKVTLGPVPAGEVVASARADGFVSRSSVAVPEIVTDDVRIALLRGATLRGDVVDVDGRPVDGATIEVIGTDSDGMPIAATPLAQEFQRAHFAWALVGPAPLIAAGELGVMTGPIPPIPNATLDSMPLMDLHWPSSFSAPTASEPWVTAFDGTFRARPIPPGRVRALVRQAEYVETTSELVTLAPGGEGTVHVVLHSGGTIEGTVVDDSGVPVAGARVEVSAMQGTLSRTTTSADDGTFAFAGIPTEVQVTLARPDEPFRAVVRRQITVPDGEKLEVSLVLPAPREPIEVSVEDDSGQPVKMAQITALSLDPEQLLRFTDFSDDAGRAKIRDAAGLALRIVIEAPGFARFTEQLDKAPSTIKVELSRGVLVEGHVTAVRGRSDVAGATVELLSEGHRRAAVTDALGVYQFAEVSPGSVHLTVSHPEYATAEADVTVASTGRSDRAFDVEAIDLAEPGSIEGHVLDAEGRPVAGARVGIGVAPAYLPVGALSTGTVTTKSDGAFRLSRVRPGNVDLEAVAPGSGRGRATGIDVDPGRTTDDVSIRLRPGSDEAEPAATGGVAITLAETHVSGQERKIVVVHVAAGSEAEHVGLVPGDVLASVDRAVPGSMADARRKLAGPDGSDVLVEVVRGALRETLRIRRERVHQ
jgi:hypothetical protein